MAELASDDDAEGQDVAYVHVRHEPAWRGPDVGSAALSGATPHDYRGQVVATSFVSLTPALLTTLLVCLAPGVALTLALGVRGYPILGYAPPLSLLAVVASGAVARIFGVDQRTAGGPLLLLAVTGVGVGICRLVSAGPPQLPDRSHRKSAAIIAASLATGAGAFGIAFAAAARTPIGWPQMPDTIFHVGAVTWMVRHGSAWIGDVPFYAAAQGGATAYPGVWHSVVASVSAWTGTQALPASHALVIVVGGLLWPISLLALARQVGVDLPITAPLVVAASLSLFAMPFQPAAWGVLWPYLLGVALIPAVMAAGHRVVHDIGTRGRGRQRVSWALLAVSSTTATLCHPSAAFGALLLAVPLVVGALHHQGRPREGRIAAVAGGLLVLAVWSIRPEAMTAKGLEWRPATPLEATAHFLSAFSPVRGLAIVIATLVLMAALVLSTRTHTRWVTWGVFVTAALSTMTLMAPRVLGSALAWPWWVDAARIRTLMVIPATVGIVLLAESMVQRHPRRLRALGTGSVPVTAALAAVSLTINSAYLETIYHPRSASAWWATPDGRGELELLAATIPEGSVVAANPYSGGTHIYLTRDVRLLFPTTGTRDRDAEVVGSSLNRMATDPAVCAVARRLDVRFVVTGSSVPYWGADQERRFKGIDSVSEDAGFVKLVDGESYILWGVPPCDTQ